MALTRWIHKWCYKCQKKTWHTFGCCHECINERAYQIVMED